MASMDTMKHLQNLLFGKRDVVVLDLNQIKRYLRRNKLGNVLHVASQVILPETAENMRKPRAENVKIDVDVLRITSRAHRSRF